MKQCINCGFFNSDIANFCAQCGFALQNPNNTTKNNPGHEVFYGEAWKDLSDIASYIKSNPNKGMVLTPEFVFSISAVSYSSKYKQPNYQSRNHFMALRPRRNRYFIARRKTEALPLIDDGKRYNDFISLLKWWKIPFKQKSEKSQINNDYSKGARVIRAIAGVRDREKHIIVILDKKKQREILELVH